MNKIVIISLIVQAAFAMDSNEFHSQKLAPEWSSKSNAQKSDIVYEKNDSWFSSLQSGLSDQFFEGTFSARVDHFRPLNQRRVNFTYNVNANHYVEGGPLYIYLKDAFDYSTQWIEGGLMVDIARETGAALFTFDHRYFGPNLPFDDASVESLELLSMEQMLGDVADFVRFIREEMSSDPTVPSPRVILWGSGVGGTMTIFAKTRYPHLIHAAWSSSGFVESFGYSYGPYNILQYTFDSAGGQCRGLVEETFSTVANLVQLGQGETIANRLNLCNPVDTNSTADVAALYENTIHAVMYYLEEYHFQGLQSFCDDMLAIEGNPLDSFARWLRFVYGGECFDSSYATSIERYSNPAWGQIGTISGRRQWYYLQCTQIATFLVANEESWLPGNVPFTYHLDKCEALFGIPFTYSIISDAFFTLRDQFDGFPTNIIYTNGVMDPFRYFGRSETPAYAGVVFDIEFSSKSADLSSIAPYDSQSLFDAKTAIVEVITRWSNSTVTSS